MKKIINLLFLVACGAQAEIVFVNSDEANEGLNDLTPVEPVGGNSGETIGQQRAIVLQAAADIIEDALDISAPLEISIDFKGLACVNESDGGTSAILGSAGPVGIHTDTASRTFTPNSLYNQLVGSDTSFSQVEIWAEFNSDIDGSANCLDGNTWYYGLDDPEDDRLSLLSVAVHEILHGMGFISLLAGDGASYIWGTTDSGERVELFDPFTLKIVNATTGKSITELSKNSRLQLMRSGQNLGWSGELVNSKSANYSEGFTNGRARLYAPGVYTPSSSASHFDTSFDPDEIMEAMYTSFVSSIGLAREALIDIGWSANPDNPVNFPPVFMEIPAQTTAEDTSFIVQLSASDINEDELVFDVSNASDGLSASVSESTLTVRPDEHFFGEGSVTASVYDGENTVTTSFNVTVTPVNDEPVIAEITDITFPEGETTTFTIPVSDVDHDLDELNISATTTNSELGMSLSGREVTFTPDENYFGEGSVTVTASDGEKQNSQSFSVTITNVNDKPVLLTEPHQTLAEDTPLTLTLTAVDLDGDALTYSILGTRQGVSAAITGAELTITPNENFNGSSSLTVIVSDGIADRGTAISLTVTPENDEPILDAIANRSFEQASGARVPLSGSDVDSDVLSFSAESLNPELVTATVEGSTLVLAAADEFNGSATVSVNVTDGELSDTKTFIATVTDGTEPSPLLILVDDQVVASGSRNEVDALSAVEFEVSGGNGQYSFEVFYQGNRPDLLVGEGNSRELTLPTTGAFAGDYLITIDDGLASVDEATVTLSRPLLLTPSVTPVMAGSTQAKLVAAGGTVGSNVIFSINGDELPEGSIAPGFADNEGDTVTTATAADNSAANNPASVFINAIGASPGTYSVEAALSSAPTASIDLEVVSQNLVAFSVTDNTDSGLEALITVDDERTSSWGIQQTMTTANDGSAELTLPDTSLNLIVSKRGYNSELIEYEGGAEVNVTLEVSDGYYFLTGSITAEGFGFNASLPELVMTMSDSSEETINAVSLSSDIAQFEWTGDISELSPQLLTVGHPSANPVEVSLRPDLGEQDLDITLVASPVDPAPENGGSDSSGGSGGGNAAWLLVTALALIGRRRLKTS